MEGLWENSSHCRCFVTNKSYILRNLNLIIVETKVFLRLEVIRQNSPLCRFFMLWSPTFWGISISCGSKTDTIKISSWLRRLWDNRQIFTSSSFCRFFHLWYPTIWGISICLLFQSRLSRDTNTYIFWLYLFYIHKICWFLRM